MVLFLLLAGEGGAERWMRAGLYGPNEVKRTAGLPSPSLSHPQKGLHGPRLGGLGCHDAREIKLTDLHFRIKRLQMR
jgi:hypothetical protein